MKKFTLFSLLFPALSGKKVLGKFNGGHISSNGGALLLQLADLGLGLSRAFVEKLTCYDQRDQESITHTLVSMLMQRIFGIALGYEDLNDHTNLRHDEALQVSIGSENPLASTSTLCRLENSLGKEAVVAMDEILMDQFIQSFAKPPKSLTLDIDATDDPVHGNQVGRHYHAYYGSYCFLPIYVTCDDKVLVAYLNPSTTDPGSPGGAILRKVITRLRKEWPGVEILVRGDSGFCRKALLSWCDRNNVYYIFGIAGNKIIQNLFKPLIDKAKELFEVTQEKQTIFTTLYYAAKSWNRRRRVIAKAEHTEKGSNTRFIVTNLPGSSKKLYQEVYCLRGDMENRIKEQQLGLFADRTSSHEWWPNQIRLFLSTFAYLLINHIRENALVGTIFERAQVDTIRLELFKIGTLIKKKRTRVLFMFSSSYPNQETFKDVYAKLVPT